MAHFSASKLILSFAPFLFWWKKHMNGFLAFFRNSIFDFWCWAFFPIVCSPNINKYPSAQFETQLPFCKSNSTDWILKCCIQSLHGLLCSANCVRFFNYFSITSSSENRYLPLAERNVLMSCSIFHSQNIFSSYLLKWKLSFPNASPKTGNRLQHNNG